MKRTYRSFVTSVLVAGSLILGVQAASAASSTATLSGGFLTITSPASNFSYSGTLTGDILPLSSSFAMSVNDPTGSKAGWKLQASIGTLTDGATPADTILPQFQTIQSVAVTGVNGTAPSDAPSNSVSYAGGLQIPTSTATIFNAAVGSGVARSTETFTTQLAVPADAVAGI